MSSGIFDKIQWFVDIREWETPDVSQQNKFSLIYSDFKYN